MPRSAWLVVIGMIVVAGLLFLPAVVRWRGMADRARSAEHLRQVGWFALWEYTDRTQLDAGIGPAERLPANVQLRANVRFPPGTRPHNTLAPTERQSLHVLLLPHLHGVRPSQPSSAEQLAPRFDPALPWDAPAHQSAITTVISVYVSPAVFVPPCAGEPALTNYIGCAGVGADAAQLPVEHARAGLFRYDGATPASAVVDGLSHTLAFIETAHHIGPWAQGGPSTVRGLDVSQPLFGPAGQIGGTFAGGTHVAYADGSVRFLADSISPTVLAALAALADGQNSE